ncbi:MAG: pilin [Patescibacteria group bacterium]
MKHLLKIFALSLFLPLFARAAQVTGGLVPCSGPDCNFCSLMQLIVNLVNFGIYNIFFPLAGLLILWGGIMMITAGGKEENYKKGKEILKNTVIAFIIVVGAWFIVNALITTLAKGAVNVGSFNPTNWFQINCK